LPAPGNRRLRPWLIAVILALAGCHSSGLTPTPSRYQQPAMPISTGELAPSQGPSSLTLNLTQCILTAREKQPRLAAWRASLAATEDGKRALETLRFPASMSRQVPVRINQASLGVTAAVAGLWQAERETDYAVQRSYCAVLYAREQERLATGVVERLTAAKEAAEKALDAGVRDATTADVNRTAVYVGLADTRRIHAAQGVKRALIALREAVGFGPEVSLDIPAGEIPELEVHPSRDEIVALALARRGELAQARIFAQVGCLEGVAQATARLQQRVQTFSAGSDIHSVQAPQGSNGTDYQPGGVAPEMPSLLVGTKNERVARAQTLNARAEAMVETTRNLIVLETEDAFLRSEETLQQASQAKAAAEAGEKLADDMRKDFAGGAKVKVEEVVTARALAAQARADYNEFRFRHAVALADLERVTSGGFTSGLVESIDRPVEQIQIKPKKADEAK